MEAKLFHLPASSLFRISGVDAARYLQGRITQNVKSLASGSAAKSLVLSPQGKIQGQFLIFRENEDSFLLVSDEIENPEEFKGAILQFKVADQLEVENLAGSYSLFSLQGKGAEDLLRKKEAELTNLDFNLQVIENSRSPFPGFDFVFKTAELTKFKEVFNDIPAGDQNELEALRIQAGRPRMGKEITDKISVADIPLEHLVSFNKGCYAGQEVVEMSIARGKPNRRLVQAKIEGKIASDSEIKLADGTLVGFLTSHYYQADSNQTMVIGFVKNSTAANAPLFTESKELELL